MNAWYYGRNRWQYRDVCFGTLPCLKYGDNYWLTAGRLQVKGVVEADSQASWNVAGGLTHDKQDAGYEAGVVEAVDPNGRLLVGIIEEHFFASVETT